MKNVIYHNPRCTKSRQALALLEASNADVKVVKYLEDPPTETALATLCKKLGMKPLELIRTKEKLFKELGLTKNDKRTDAEWIRLMVENPKLIERPIVVYNGKVALGRPTDNILKIL